jgi:transposase
LPASPRGKKPKGSDARHDGVDDKARPKRWIVERRFAWLEKSRRLWKNCERLLNTRLQFIHLVFLALVLKRSGTGSQNLFPIFSGSAAGPLHSAVSLASW